MVNFKVDAGAVEEFPRDERISPRSVFADTKYYYDPDFWNGFNIILPEGKLEKIIINNINEAIGAQLIK